MKVFFQHVGEAGTKRDFPRTLGDDANGLRHFTLSEISDSITGFTEAELSQVAQKLDEAAPTGFQIWGIPSGARSILRNLEDGDALMLLETITDGGKFGYFGEVIHVFRSEQFQLSSELWGESKFSIIILLKGKIIDYAWSAFCDEFQYKKNWNPAGNTYQIGEPRIASSSFKTPETILSTFLHRASRTPSFLEGQSIPKEFLEEPSFLEGNPVLRNHLSLERSSALVEVFKSSLLSKCCVICGFDFERTYGTLGKDFIEAHHNNALSEHGAGITSISDLSAVCSNCHRMLHRKFPAISVSDLIRVLDDRRNRIP